LAELLAGAISTLQKTSGQIGDATKPLSDMSGTITQALQTIQETEAKVQDNQKELSSVLLSLQKFTEAIPALWKQYEESFNKIDGDLGKAFGELAKGSEEFRSGIQAFVTLIDDQFSRVIAGLSDAMKELADASGMKKPKSSYFARLRSKQVK
jgi:methyl-accepting chemotaxis protein